MTADFFATENTRAIKIVVSYLKGQNDSRSSLKNFFQSGGTYFPVKGRKFPSTCNSEFEGDYC